MVALAHTERDKRPGDQHGSVELGPERDVLIRENEAIAVGVSFRSTDKQIGNRI